MLFHKIITYDWCFCKMLPQIIYPVRNRQIMRMQISKSLVYTDWGSNTCSTALIIWENKMLFTYEEFKNHYNIRLNFIEYFSIRSAIPHRWKLLIRGIGKLNLIIKLQLWSSITTPIWTSFSHLLWMFKGSMFTLNMYCHFQLSLIFLSLLSEVSIYVEWHFEYWNIL
jgi:hypothetical protein